MAACLGSDQAISFASDIVAIEQDLAEIEKRYGEIAIPAAMMFGSADRVLDHVRHGLPMREKIPGLDFELVDGQGHMLQFMVPDQAIGMVKRTADRAFS